MIEVWGSHAPYILMAYGAAAVGAGFLLLEPWWRRKQLQNQLRAQWRREQLAKTSISESQL